MRETDSEFTDDENIFSSSSDEENSPPARCRGAEDERTIMRETDSEFSDDENPFSSSPSSSSSNEENPPTARGRARGARTRGGIQRQRAAFKGSGQHQQVQNGKSGRQHHTTQKFQSSDQQGPTIASPDTIRESVHLFLTDELIADIVTETNRYAIQCIVSADISDRVVSPKWAQNRQSMKNSNSKV